MMRSKITLGLWALGNSEGFHAPVDSRKAKNLIKTAYKYGIHSFDSAFSYNTDALLYSALREIGVKTESVEIFEKVMPYKTLRKKAEASLRALRSECIEALIIHWPREEEELYPALRDAEKLVYENKFRALGISNFPSELAKKAASDFNITYNEYYSSPVQTGEAIKGLKSLKYGIFAFGSLLRDDIPDDERRNLFYYEGDAYPHFIKLKDTIKMIAEKREESIKKVLLAFALHDDPFRLIIGAGKAEQLEDLECSPLSEEEYKKIEDLSAALSIYNNSDNIFSHTWRAQ